MHGASLVAAAVAATLVLPGCGGARTCEDVADDLVGELQNVLDEAAEMSPAALAESGEVPEFLQDVQARGEELEAEAEELGCTDDQMRDLVAERIDTLEAEPGTVAEVLLQFLTSEDFFDETSAPTAPTEGS